MTETAQELKTIKLFIAEDILGVRVCLVHYAMSRSASGSHNRRARSGR